MSTRSWIFNDENGACRGIYCHNDGYPSWNGKILQENYNKTNINKLLDLGDLSSLDTTLETCIAYHRDRGEDMSPNMVFDNPQAVLNKTLKSDAEFIYLLSSEGTWFVAAIPCWRDEEAPRFKNLQEVLDALSTTKG